MDNPFKLVVLHAPPGAGKNTFADGMIAQGVQHISFGNAIRAWISDHCPQHPGMVGATKGEAKDVSQECLNGRSPRDLQVFIGLLENFFPRIWVDGELSRVDPTVPAVLDSAKDNRQMWHAMWSMVERWGKAQAFIIEIVRPGYEWGRLNDSRTPLHFAGHHFAIINDDTPETLARMGADFARGLLSGHIFGGVGTLDHLSLQRDYEDGTGRLLRTRGNRWVAKASHAAGNPGWSFEEEAH